MDQMKLFCKIPTQVLANLVYRHDCVSTEVTTKKLPQASSCNAEEDRPLFDQEAHLDNLDPPRKQTFPLVQKEIVCEVLARIQIQKTVAGRCCQE